MIHNLQTAYARNGNLTVRDVALEVAFSGESWPTVCEQAEKVTGCKPGLYPRLRARLKCGQTLNMLVRDALKGTAAHA